MTNRKSSAAASDAMSLGWEPYAETLADRIVHRQSRWYAPLCVTPRHLLVPNWWTGRDATHWSVNQGLGDAEGWLHTAYSDHSLVTQVNTLHADHAQADTQVTGLPTSSSTLPGLMVQMYRHACLYDGAQVLDVGTGSGYGAALLAARLGAGNVTSVDVDPYLVKAAKRRLHDIGVRPRFEVCDATGPLPGEFDRIVASVAVRPIPVSWLKALWPEGRLVTTLTDLRVILSAVKTPDGGAAGRIAWDRAGFMASRHGPGYPDAQPVREACEKAAERARDGDGDLALAITPVLDLEASWELWSLLAIDFPGLRACYDHTGTDPRHLYLSAADGSWAYAEQTSAATAPTVRQGGPGQIWTVLEDHRLRWLRDGHLPLYGSTAVITPDGVIHLTRGRWEATITRPI